jgi:5-(carboxyamino)imidazole ribonucleotide synthase
MVNLLGAPGYTGPAIYDGLDKILAMEGVYPHLYGKRLTKPFRKMGHATIIGDQFDQTRDKALQVKDKLKIIA